MSRDNAAPSRRHRQETAEHERKRLILHFVMISSRREGGQSRAEETQRTPLTEAENARMPTRSRNRKRFDPNVTTFRFVQSLTDEPEPLAAIPLTTDGKNSVALNKLGGVKETPHVPRSNRPCRARGCKEGPNVETTRTFVSNNSDPSPP